VVVQTRWWMWDSQQSAKHEVAMVKFSKNRKGERKEINKWKKEGERKAKKKGENKIRFFLLGHKKQIHQNTKMKKKKARGPFYSQNLGFKGRKGNRWKMMWVQTRYHELDPPLRVITYWASISRIFLKSFEQKS
jgi:hypothetical protein